jgi:threonine dehydrogenase-like Zn-dependent dehydrogenase
VPDRIAALAEPLTTILAGCEKAPIRPEGRFLILGNGPLGQMVAICLSGLYGVPREAITMTGRDWDNRRGARSLAGEVLDADDPQNLASLHGKLDVAFECVGGDTSGTLDQAVECLRPGGSAVLFGPSEKSVLFNTREVIGKGLTFIGANRSFVRHFETVLERMRERRIQKLLEALITTDPLVARSADDLNRALYHAWTRRDAAKTLIAWGGPE